jgi:hypothetical protein
MGELGGGDLALTLAGGAVWAALLLTLTERLWALAIRRLVVQGG